MRTRGPSTDGVGEGSAYPDIGGTPCPPLRRQGIARRRRDPMRGSRRKGRRLRRAGATFSLIGLVMTVFLAIGQVGLIAANADGWSDRSDAGSASAESGRGDGFTVKASDAVSEKSSAAKEAVAAPLVAARAV